MTAKEKLFIAYFLRKDDEEPLEPVAIDAAVGFTDAEKINLAREFYEAIGQPDECVGTVADFRGIPDWAWQEFFARKLIRETRKD